MEEDDEYFDNDDLESDLGEILCINPTVRLTQIENGEGFTPEPANLIEVFQFFETNYYLETCIGNYDVSGSRHEINVGGEIWVHWESP